MNTEQKQQEFDRWVASIEERISQWKETLPPDIVKQLHTTHPNSLIVLEKYLIEYYESYQDFVEDKLPYDAVLSYVGEVFIKAFGYAEWYMELRAKV